MANPDRFQSDEPLRFLLTVIVPGYAAGETLAEMLRDLAQGFEEGELKRTRADEKAVITDPEQRERGWYLCYPVSEEVTGRR